MLRLKPQPLPLSTLAIGSICFSGTFVVAILRSISGESDSDFPQLSGDFRPRLGKSGA
jgi:hypothetical protein